LVRRHNLSLLVRTLRTNGVRSRAQLAFDTGLTKATISSLIGDLTERGLVAEIGMTGSDRRGRPGTLIELDGRGVVSVGIELNVGEIAALVTDVAGRTVFEARKPLGASQLPRHRVIDALVRFCRNAIDEARRRGAYFVSEINVAVPGVVDADGRTLVFAPNLQWSPTPLAERLEDDLGGDVTVVLHNESNLAAIAEHRLGSMAGHDPLVLVFCQVGVGGGIAIGGHVMRGASGLSGEIGHMAMIRNGAPCGCGGHGCWETLVGLAPLLRAAMGTRAEAMLLDRTQSPHEHVVELVSLANAGNTKVLKALNDVGTWLGLGIANLANIVDPSAVVLGGIYVDLAQWLLPPLRSAFDAQAMRAGLDRCQIAASSLGVNAVVVGGAILGADRIVDNPLLAPVLASDPHTSRRTS
jgi:predicted NBD/HSP70 family sugar kinase